MRAGHWDFEVTQGVTWRIGLTLRGQDQQLMDLSGYTARMQARETINSPVPLLELSTAPGGYMTIDGPSGRLEWAVPGAVTATWTWRHGVYDLFLTSAGGEPQELLDGRISVSRRVTR